MLFLKKFSISYHMTQINAYKKFPLCGAEMEIVLYDVNQFVSESYFFEIQQEAKRLEKIFTFFDNASELSILNQEGSLFTSQ